MDPVAHTLFGAGMAEIGLARRSRLGVVTLLVGANLPDLDVLAYAWGADAALEHRRGWTHGALAMVVLPLVLAALVVLFSRWRRSRAPTSTSPSVSSAWLLSLACLSVWSHPLLDWLNTYGIRLLMPFDDRWLYGDVLFIVDPWIWLILGGMLFVVRPGRGVAILLALLALFASLLLFSSPLSPLSSRVVWLGGLVLAIVLRRVGRLMERGRLRLARAAFAAVLVYIFVMVGAAMAAKRVVAAELRRKGIEVSSLMVGPVPVDPSRREVVASSDEWLHFGSFEWWRSPRLIMEERPRPRPESSPVVEAALAAACVRGLISWIRFPFVEVDPLPSGWEVFILDARYTRRRTEGFGGARVVLGDDLEPRCPDEDDGG